MFHLILTLIYSIPGIYVYFRLRNLFISKGFKTRFTIIFLLLFAIYPISGIIPESLLITKILSFLAGYLLPFFLYVFLQLLVFDIFLLVNLIFRILPKETRKSYCFRVRMFSAILVISLLIVIGGIINLNTISISYYEVLVPRKNSDLEKLRVAFVADIHINSNVPVGYIEKFVQKVKSQEPDVMFYGGDIVDDRKIHPQLDKLVGLLQQIKPRFGVYGILGNHEFYRGQTDGSFFRNAGIILLNDSIVKVGNNFIVAGRYDEHFHDRKPIADILGDSIPDLPILLLDHRPTSFDEVIKTSVNAQFSGHTHNGQLFPFNFIIKSIYELGWGYKQKSNTHFFVTSGLRLWGPPVKTTGKSEIILVDFKFE